MQELVNDGEDVLFFYNNDKEVTEIYILGHTWNLFEQSFFFDMARSCAPN